MLYALSWFVCWRETLGLWNLYRHLTGYDQVCSDMPQLVKVTDLQYLLRNDRQNSYDLLHTDRLSQLRFCGQTSPTNRVSRCNHSLFIFLRGGRNCYETVASARRRGFVQRWQKLTKRTGLGQFLPKTYWRRLWAVHWVQCSRPIT